MPAPDDAEAAEAGRRGALRKLDPQQRRTAVTEILIELLSEILRLPPEKVDPGLSLLNMGIDSLMAMETQVAIEKRIGLKVSVLELMKGNTMAELARQMADLLEQPPEAAEQQPEPEEIRPAARPSVAEPPMAGAPGILAGIDELSDDEVEDEIRRLVLEDEEIRV
jgi:acyl carrier protein